jgi:4-hydroxy-tetrahydrodipicolinate reductase
MKFFYLTVFECDKLSFFISLEGGMINVLIHGCTGRMGTTNVRVFHSDKEVKIVGGVVEKGNPFVGMDVGEVAGIGRLGVSVSDNIEDYISLCDVVVDFSVPSATFQLVDIALKHKKKLVIGTTGLSEDIMKKILEASESIAIVQSPNFSVGVNLMLELTKVATQVLGEDFDIELVEVHHNKKKDSPSGTALKILEVIKSIRKDYKTIYGREGIIGERPKEEIGVFAVRGGDVVGDHTVMYLGYGERLEIAHRATSRETFSRGALRAAKFLMTKDKGFYTMKDVLGF